MAGQNRFLQRYFDGEPEFPQGFFALVDQDEGDRLLFDAVSAEFFERQAETPRGIRQWARLANDAPIFVIELRDKSDSAFRDWTKRRGFDLGPRLDEAKAPIWFRFWQSQNGHRATVYHNLYQEGRPLALEGERVPDDLAQALTAAFTLDADVASQSEIEVALANLTGAIDWIGVYDVGQGGANGLCDGSETPLAYFDLGGGVLGNTSTFPAGLLTDVCYVHAPPVVLSHWDWDHWSSGNTFPQAQTLKWIVPNQSLGAVHTTFAAALSTAGNLLVWPPGLPDVTVGNVTIRKCTHAGRNHSGLALDVTGPNGELPILLTGDARYTAVPGAVGRRYTSVIAPHHGADMHSHATPVGGTAPGARTAYTYGPGNTFTHPRPVTEQDHHNNGWLHASQGAATPLDRHTATRPGGGLGHIGLTWSAGATLPGHACGQPGCAVGLVQT